MERRVVNGCINKVYPDYEVYRIYSLVFKRMHLKTQYAPKSQLRLKTRLYGIRSTYFQSEESKHSIVTVALYTAYCAKLSDPVIRYPQRS